MDTTTINYGIQKVTETWMKVAPQVQNVSEKYVEFVLMKLWVGWLIVAVVFLISIPVSIKLWKAAEKDKENTGILNRNDLLQFMGYIFCPFSSVLLFIALSVISYYMFLALKCPEMYTIHQIVGK